MSLKLISRTLGSLAPHETVWLVVFFLSLVTSLLGAIHHSKAEIQDNEFAEFEEFDDEFETVVPASRAGAGQHGGVGSSDQPGGKGGGDDGAGRSKDAGFSDKAPASSGGYSAGRNEGDDEDDEVVLEAGDDEDEGVVQEEADEFDTFHDEEEFENFEREKQIKPTHGKSDPPPMLKITDVPPYLRNNWFNFQVELIMLFGLTVYLLNYAFGKNKNQNLAATWFDFNKELLEINFAVVGDDGRDKEVPSEGVLMKESDSLFSVWCSGRAACQSMLVQLRFLKRQDLVSILAKVFKPTYDQLVIRVNVDHDGMDTFVFSVGKKKTLTKMAKDMNDLYQFCGNRKAAENFGVPASMMVLSELGEATSAMLDPKIVATLNKFEECIDYIHVSDQFSGPRPQDYENETQKLPDSQKVIIFGFNIPGKITCSEKHIEYINPLMHFVFYCVDKTKRFRLSREAKSKADKNRLRVEESFLKTTHQARQEAAQTRKEDKIRERKERMMNEEDPEKQRRLEKQELKREAKRNQPKMKQLKIKAM